MRNTQPPLERQVKRKKAKWFSPLLLSLGWSVFEGIEHIVLEQLLV